MRRAPMVSTVAVCFAIGCALAVRGMAADPPILFGPHVNNVSTTSARIVWVAPAGSAPGRARLAGGGVEFGAVSFTSPITGREEVLQTVPLEGLKPGTRYDYRLDVGRATTTGSFTTSPEGAQPFRFVAYGDTRTRPDSHKSVADAIAAEDPALVVCTGDMVSNGDVWDQWQQQFFDPAQAYLSKSAIWPARGNHEQSAVFLKDLFDLPHEEFVYSFDYANAHFAVLDNYTEDSAAMLQWLDRDLARSDAEWKFVMYHVPTFNVGGHGSKWGRDDFLPVIEKHGVDFVLTGHSHIYERFLPIGPPGKKPVNHIVTGGGGAPSYDATPSPILAGGIGMAGLHYCVFDIDGNRCTLTVKLPDGTVIDELELVKTDGMYQDEVMALAVTTEAAAETAFVLADMQADFPEIPEAGGTVQVTVKTRGFPDGSVLTFGPAERHEGWRVVEQKLTSQDEEITFEATAPPELEVSVDGFQTPLRVAVTVPIQGRDVSFDNLEVGLSEDTLRRVLPAPAPVDVVRAPNTITIDGSPADWAAVRATPLPYHDGKTGSIKFCWTEDGLYGLVTVADDAIAVNAKEPWRADSFELFVDKAFTRNSRKGRQDDQYMLSPNPDAGPGDALVAMAWPSQNRTSELKCAWRPTDGGYVLEYLVAASLLAPAGMEAGTVMGLNFGLNNDGATVEHFYCNKSENEAWGRPILWGAVRLSGE